MTDDARGVRRIPEELLSAYVDGELDAAQRRDVEARLARDVTWQRILDEIVGARDAVRSLPEREPPSGFWLRVLTHVAEVAERDHGELAASAAVVSITPPVRRRTTRWGAIGAAAAAIAIGVVVASPSGDGEVAPSLPALADQHAAAASTQSDPVSNFAPVAVPVELGP
jgi:anti-sigma factor RsiW